MGIYPLTFIAEILTFIKIFFMNSNILRKEENMLNYVAENVLEPYKDLDRKKLRDELANLQRDVINENIPVLMIIILF